MKTRNVRKHKSSEEGYALAEALMFIIAFVILTAYCIDFFTIVHTAIVNTIAARTYAFETFEHRSDIGCLRDENMLATGIACDGQSTDFTGVHQRFHGLGDENENAATAGESIPAVGRRLTQVENAQTSPLSNSATLDDGQNQTGTVRIRSGYGICVDSQCPADPFPVSSGG